MKYLFLAALLITNVSAAVSVSFTKSDASTLVVTISASSQFTAATAGQINGFIIKQAGQASNLSGFYYSTDLKVGTSTATVPVSGIWQDGVGANNDLSFYLIPSASYQAGDVLIFTGGTVTLTSYMGAAPASGSYEVVLVDSTSEITRVPETSSALISCLGAAALFRRRRALD